MVTGQAAEPSKDDGRGGDLDRSRNAITMTKWHLGSSFDFSFSTQKAYGPGGVKLSKNTLQMSNSKFLQHALKMSRMQFYTHARNKFLTFEHIWGQYSGFVLTILVLCAYFY